MTANINRKVLFISLRPRTSIRSPHALVYLFSYETFAVEYNWDILYLPRSIVLHFIVLFSYILGSFVPILPTDNRPMVNRHYSYSQNIFSTKNKSILVSFSDRQPSYGGSSNREKCWIEKVPPQNNSHTRTHDDKIAFAWFLMNFAEPENFSSGKIDWKRSGWFYVKSKEKKIPVFESRKLFNFIL